MTYETLDQSVADGSPVELFTFVGPGVSYRYTDADEVQELSGQFFQPLQIKRGAIEIGSVLESTATVDIDVPYDCDLARNFAFKATPDKLDVTIQRVHRDAPSDPETLWKGFTTFYSTTGRITTISTGTLLQAALSGPVNNIYGQRLCNHDVYDARCSLSEADFTTETTVTEVDDTSITVADDGEDNAFRAGELRVDRTGERRFITANASGVITVSHPLIDLEVGDSVSLVQGCNRSPSQCQTKFDNYDQFGGMRFIPTTNPFEEDL